MKKRILSILLTLCMVLMLFPVTAFAEEGKSVSFTVTADKTEAQPGETITFTVTMGAVDSLGYLMLGLSIPEGMTYVAHSGTVPEGLKEKMSAENVEFSELPYLLVLNSNYTSTADTVLMTFQCTVNDDATPGDKAVGVCLVYDDEGRCLDVDSKVIAATFNPATVTVPEPALAITVDGFQVGKTPADTTLSFASTNLGVTFGKDDVAFVGWLKYDDEFDQWESVYDDEQFEAGTRYELYLELNGKGLSELPAVTINGKTPELCEFGNGGRRIVIECEFGTSPASAPTITIDGPDVVCAQQDYEFTVTAPDGVTIVSAGYGNDYIGNNVELTPNEDGTLSGVVPTSSYSMFEGSFTLSVSGTVEGQTTGVFASKTVEVSKKHIYEDGVCGCGAVQQYTVEYIGSGDDPICMDFKTHGKDLTLLGETFKRDGYVQTGWIDEYGAIYDLGDLYTTDADMTFYPYFEKLITLTVPYTTTVALGDAGEPDETTFELALIDGWGEALAGGNVEVTAAVTTDGAGDYDSSLTITGPEQTLWYMLSEGAFVQQVDAGADGWTVDDTVWGLLMDENPVAYAMNDDAAASEYTVYVVPTSIGEFGNYDIDWDAIDWEDPQSADMTFTNTYTKSIAKPTEQPKPTGGDTPKPDTDAVQTGDNRNPALWFALLAVSAAGVIGTGVYSKRRRSSRAK